MTVDDAIAELYGAAPQEFTARRDELAAAAKRDGDPARAKAITALRKPTVAAAVVNRLVHSDPDVVTQLTGLGDELRDAQQNLESGTLRELTTRRRRLVAELTRAAFAAADHRAPSTSVRDEVTATLDAALADPQVAAQLGRLTKAQHWSGFGVAADAGPELTLVRGGKDRARPREPSRPQRPRTPPAEKRRNTRALDKARATFDEADQRLVTAEQDASERTERVHALSARLGELQRDLDAAKRDRDKARREVKAARARRREARSALDRAERTASE